MRIPRALAVFLVAGPLAAAAVGGATWWWASRTLHRPLSPELSRVEIPRGLGAREILARLEDAGLVADDTLARAYLVYVLDDPSLKAGEYAFERPVNTIEVLDKIVRGEVVQHLATVIEGLTLEETARALADAGFGDLDRFLRAMRDPSPIAELDPEAETLEGYLFPETYAFSRGVTEREIVATMVATFRESLEERVLPALERSERIELATNRTAPGPEGAEIPPAERPPDRPAVDPGEADRTLAVTLRELVTLASIVEKEARLDEERPLIAAVYVNRLLAGMGLYADPTVIHALKLRGEWDGNLRRDDLQVDSPYNTYRYAGLPPGPIASPGLGSLLAAARPADTEHLYFVSRNDGSHVFAESLAEHNRNVSRWQKEYWRERWARERAEAARGPQGQDGESRDGDPSDDPPS